MLPTSSLSVISIILNPERVIRTYQSPSASRKSERSPVGSSLIFLFFFQILQFLNRHLLFFIISWYIQIYTLRSPFNLLQISEGWLFVSQSDLFVFSTDWIPVSQFPYRAYTTSLLSILLHHKFIKKRANLLLTYIFLILCRQCYKCVIETEYFRRLL